MRCRRWPVRVPSALLPEGILQAAALCQIRLVLPVVPSVWSHGLAHGRAPCTQAHKRARACVCVCVQAKIARIDEVVAEIQADQNAYGWVIDHGPGSRPPIAVFELAAADAALPAQPVAAQ